MNLAATNKLAIPQLF